MRINIAQRVQGKSVLRLMIIANWFLDHYGRNSEIPSQPYAIIISYRLITLQGWLDCAFLGHRLITAARLDCAPDAFRCIVARTSNEYRLSSHRYYKTGYNRHKLRVASVIFTTMCKKYDGAFVNALQNRHYWRIKWLFTIVYFMDLRKGIYSMLNWI